MSLNRINVMGRIGKDLELRRTQSGKAVTSFPIAVDRDGKDAGTDWFDVVAWERTAEFAAQYCAKGRKVVVDGRLQARDWTDKDGGKRRSAEVVADNVYFGDSKRDGATGGDYAAPAAGYSVPSGGYAAPVGGTSSGFSEIDDEDGDLPF